MCLMTCVRSCLFEELLTFAARPDGNSWSNLLLRANLQRKNTYVLNKTLLYQDYIDAHIFNIMDIFKPYLAMPLPIYMELEVGNKLYVMHSCF